MYYTSLLAFFSLILFTSLSLQASEEKEENSLNAPLLKILLSSTNDTTYSSPLKTSVPLSHATPSFPSPSSIQRHSFNISSSPLASSLHPQNSEELSPLSLYTTLGSYPVSLPDLPSSPINEFPSSYLPESPTLQENNTQLFINNEQFKISPVLQEQIITGFNLYLLSLLNQHKGS